MNLSRSRKSTPRAGDKKSKDMKRIANRKLRRQKLSLLLPHKSYKKNFCSYDICDYEEIGTTFEQFYQSKIHFWYQYGKHWGKPYPSKDEALKEYKKWYLRK